MIVAVEGMDGAGKTTICSHIERTFNFINIERPTKYLYEDANGKIDYNAFYRDLKIMYKKSPKERSIFFGKGNYIAVNKYKNSNVVLDRHLVSNYYWNGDRKQKRLYIELIRLCGIPDLTIFLYATPEERYNRLKRRSPKDMDLYDKSVFEDGTYKHIEFMNEYGFNYVMVDTNGKSIREVCNMVDHEIKKLIYKRSKDDEDKLSKHYRK